MKKKTFQLVSGIIGGVCAIACAFVSFFNPPFESAIIAAIGISGTAITEICTLFVTAQ